MAEGGGQRAHYLTLELTTVTFQSSGPLPRWTCLCLDNGRVGLVSLGAEDESAVAWTRIA